MLICLNFFLHLGSGCGSVGRAATSNIRDLRFKPHHWQNFIIKLYNRKDKNKEKEPRKGPSFKNFYLLLWQIGTKLIAEPKNFTPQLLAVLSKTGWMLVAKIAFEWSSNTDVSHEASVPAVITTSIMIEMLTSFFLPQLGVSLEGWVSQFKALIYSRYLNLVFRSHRWMALQPNLIFWLTLGGTNAGSCANGYGVCCISKSLGSSS